GGLPTTIMVHPPVIIPKRLPRFPMTAIGLCSPATGTERSEPTPPSDAQRESIPSLSNSRALAEQPWVARPQRRLRVRPLELSRTIVASLTPAPGDRMHAPCSVAGRLS